MADMLIQHVEIAYDVTLIAAEKETLSLMCNAVAASLYALTNHALAYKGYLFGSELDMQAVLNSQKLVSFTDVSPSSNGKVFAATISLNVTAEVRSAWELSTRRVVTNAD